MPRAIRVWDEAWLPGKTVSLDGDDVGTLLKTARRCSPEFRSALMDFMAKIEKTGTGDMLDVPDWERLHGVTHGDLLAALPGGPDQARQGLCATTASLFMVGGHSVRIWRDNQTGSGILTYKETLPKDLAPLLVLDASGRVRQTYRDLEASRGLQRLHSAEKDYAPLRVHWWERGGGKSSFNLNGAELSRGVVETIQTKPTERWLVVTHKKDAKVGNVEWEVKKRLPPEVKPNVSFITWGNHVATNEHVDVPNLILAGTLFMKPSHYVALTHLAQDRPTEAGFAPDDAIERTTQGEHANLVLQAVCRGRVRKSDGDRCLPMDAYLIATKRSGIGDLLPTIFPGCTVLRWDPLSEKQTLTPSLRAAREFLQRELAKGITEVTYRDLQVALRISPKKFPERVSQRPEWPELIAGLGLETYGGTKRARGVRLKVIAEAA